MDSVASFLQSISIYPIPAPALADIAAHRGLDLEDDGASLVNTKEYRLAKADVLSWLAFAPNVSQGGVSYSFSEYERKQFLAFANSIYAEEGEKRAKYGYKGSRL